MIAMVDYVDMPGGDDDDDGMAMDIDVEAGNDFETPMPKKGILKNKETPETVAADSEMPLIESGQADAEGEAEEEGKPQKKGCVSAVHTVIYGQFFP